MMWRGIEKSDLAGVQGSRFVYVVVQLYPWLGKIIDIFLCSGVWYSNTR